MGGLLTATATAHAGTVKSNASKTIIQNKTDQNCNDIEEEKKDDPYAPNEDLTKHLREHLITDLPITCPNMKYNDSKDPLSCDIYKSMKKYHQLNQNNLNHLVEFNHYTTKRTEVPQCKYGQDCHAFNRMTEGGYKIEDRCHLELYRHAPRGRIAPLNENMNTYKFLQNMDNDEKSPLCPLYEPTEDDKGTYWNKTNGWLQALREEVEANGCKSVLITDTGDSLMTIVDEKMKHIRHRQLGSPLNRAEMLAIILYTGSKCYDSLCKTQRNDDYKTWKWLDLCLYSAIDKIWRREKGSYSLYSGLANVTLDKIILNNGFFVTYTSTSWRKEVALSFIYQYGETGMLLQMDQTFRNNTFNRCCDVSWISKFPDECEVLMARGGQFSDRWKTKYIDIAKGNYLNNVVDDMKEYDDYVDYKIAHKIEPLYIPTKEEKTKYWNETDGWNNILFKEVQDNGFDDHIDAEKVLENAKVYLNAYHNRKMGLKIDQILAIILYFDYSAIGYDLSASQRMGNYKKWKWLDLMLYSAIWTLSKHRETDFNLWYPLRKVKIANENDRILLEKGYYSSYIEASPNICVAQSFAEDGGLMIKLEAKHQKKGSFVCGSIAPYTSFPNEPTWVIARSCNITHGAWQARVIDQKKFVQSKGQIQVVKLMDYGHLMQANFP